MGAYHDYTGLRFGRLIVVRDTGMRKFGRVVWECQCDCGNTVNVSSIQLTNGNTKSCGCLRRDTASELRRPDISGKRFGRLVAESYAGHASNGRALWRCACDCGNIVTVTAKNLMNGNTRSCGCLKIDTTRERVTKFHTQAEKHLGNIWNGIKTRCYNENHHTYGNYGARGIEMCQEWREDSVKFVEWALANGYTEGSGLTIERIDNNGPYAPWNCRLATGLEQANNKRNNRVITVRGVTKAAAQWARAIGVEPAYITNMYNRVGAANTEAYINACL